jgi:hypothetical protein
MNQNASRTLHSEAMYESVTVPIKAIPDADCILSLGNVHSQQPEGNHRGHKPQNQMPRLSKLIGKKRAVYLETLQKYEVYK